MQVFKRILSSCQKTARFYSIKRKFPIDPHHLAEMPVFQYNVSPRNKHRVYVWGNAKTGALGIPKSKKRESSERIEYLKSPKRLAFADTENVILIGCGFGFSVFAVKTNTGQKLYGSGINADSQLGYHQTTGNKYLGTIVVPQPIFIPFAHSETVSIKKLAAGRAHLVVLSNEGLHLLGNNAYGQCGRMIVEDEAYEGSKYVNHIESINNNVIVDFACGQDHTLAITENGHVYSCGWGADGQTGLESFSSNSQFSRVLGDISHEKIVKVAGVSDFVLALSSRGEVFGWGNTEYAQISTHDNSQQISKATHINMCKNLGKIVDIAAGGSFCVVLNEDGHVFVWGFGLLGIGPDVQSIKTPIKIPPQLFGLNDFNTDVKVEKIACGLSHIAAVTNHGDLYTWGRNRECCLGLGNEKDQYFPLKVSMAGFVTDVACGLDHSIAICKPFI